MYLYKTFIIKDSSSYIGLDASELAQHAADKTDYETNHQSDTQKESAIVIAATTFISEIDYTAFSALIDGEPINWTDVKEINGGNEYELYILSGSPL